MLNAIDCTKRRTSKVMAALLGAALALFLGAGSAHIEQTHAAEGGFAAGKARVEAQSVYGVYVNGVNLTDGGWTWCGDGWANYDKASKTLTLNNAYIDENYGFANVQLWGNTNDTVTVQLNGANTIDYCGSGFGSGIDSDPNLVFTGSGALTINDAAYGIQSDGNITIKSGTFRMDASTSGFSCKKMYMKGGKLASVAGGIHAVRADSMSNAASQLGYINGKLPWGAKFAKGGNAYQVNSNNGTVTLTKYASTKTKTTVNTANFGYEYRVDVIGEGAFAKKKVKKVTLGSNVSTVKKNAFSKTTKLTTLTIKDYSGWNGVTFQSKALSKAGKKSGKKLTVKVQTYKRAKDVKAELRRAGLNKKAKVKTF